ncbi:DegT/DnrJ/EryC1/StrS family aminotransferase [bacterium]|nr:DegT/DnrJ/EryC1/StrS family aminotransferase [bacterium]
MQTIRTPLFKVFMPPTVKSSIEETLFSGFLAEGEKVAEFTQLVSQFIHNPQVVMMNSCTMALTIAYQLSGVGPGDEVITTPLTSIATNMPILQLGGKPVWADVDPRTGQSDPSDIEKLITQKTKAIVALHKEGDPAYLDEIHAVAKKYDIRVIEDAAHAFGAKYKGTRIGTHSDFVCFSFQAIKHITTGDGGALCCKSENDYLRARKMKWFGVERENRGTGNIWENDIQDRGYKGNMNDIAAAIGIAQMKHIDEIIEKFNRNGLAYSESLMGTAGITILERNPENFSTFWGYCVLADHKHNLEKKLREQGVAAHQIHPRNDVYSIFKESKRKLPQVDYFCQKELSLPCGWWVDDEERERICSIIQSGW